MDPVKRVAVVVSGLTLMGLAVMPRAEAVVDVSERDGGVAVSMVSTAAFVEAATADGFTAAQRQALVDSGDYINYPVTVRVGQVASPNTVERTPQGPFSVGVWCRSANANRYFVEGVSTTGFTVYRFEVAEGYCWRHRRGNSNNSIISQDNTPTITHSIPVWAQAAGWTWEGLDDSGAFGPSYYQWLNQGPASALKTWRQGHMKYCPVHVPIGCQGRFPWIHIYNHADGTNHVSGGITS